jgi:glycine cleavage system regulatory protein
MKNGSESETGRRLTKEETTEELARTLYESMERADPSDPEMEWRELSADDRSFYVNRILDLMDHRQLLLSALEGTHRPQHNS